ncbi:MAG: hypothetical protein ABIR24_13780 [Verrucomicrobiota bacterium]
MVSIKNSILLVEEDGHDALLKHHVFWKANLAIPIHGAHEAEESMGYESESSFADAETIPTPLLDLNWSHPSRLEVRGCMPEKGSSLNRLPVVVFTSSRAINRAYEKLSKVVKHLDFFGLLHNDSPKIYPA